ncbi:hypothetical protein [uncultured Shewanella sp.]|uniref:hypothetical protein n=1 Tax=uncultured Shewanella sp. TaxID=173975 RepID=UPI00260521E3|nr:hypothetical protein [uncultured Shewanella sp.]
MKKMSRLNTFLWLSLINLSLSNLLGCNDNSSSSDSTESLNVVYLGTETTDTDISELLSEKFTLYSTSEDLSSDTDIAAIFIGGEHIDDVLSSSLNEAFIKTVLNQGKPVTLIQADGEHTNKLMAHLGFSDIYAVGLDTLTWRELRLVDEIPIWTNHRHEIPSTETVGDSDFITELNRQAIAHSIEDLIAEIKQASSPTSAAVLNINELKDLAANSNSPKQITTEQGETLLKPVETTNEVDDGNLIHNIVTPQSSTDIYRIYYDDDYYSCDELNTSNCASIASDYPNSRYSVYVYTYTVYSEDLDTDFHIVKVSATLAMDNAYTHDDKNQRSWFATEYGLHSVLRYHRPGNPTCGYLFTPTDGGLEICNSSYNCNNVLQSYDGLGFVESSPATQTNCSTSSYTTSLTESISGTTQIGSSNTTSVTGGMSFATSESNTVASLCISNISNSTAYSEMAALFKMPSPDVKSNSSCYTKVESPSNQARSTFEGRNFYVWSTSRSIRDTQASLGYDKLEICGGLYYKWKKEKIHAKCTWGSGRGKRDTSTWYGYQSFQNTFQLTPIN